MLPSSLRKIQAFHLISWCGNLVERHSFRILCGNCAFPQNFHTGKFGEISVFYAMIQSICGNILTRQNLAVLCVLNSKGLLNGYADLTEFPTFILVVDLNYLVPVHIFGKLLGRGNWNWNIRATNRGRQKGSWANHSSTNIFSEEFYFALILLFVPFRKYWILSAFSRSQLFKTQ